MNADSGHKFRYAYQGFPLNAWYVAAFSREVGDKPLMRWLCGQRVVMFRTADGEPVALLDRCPHRASPLSEGKVVGNAIQCPYHGIEFGPGGKCVKIPSQNSIPDRMRAISFPVKEVWKWIWIWPGDPAKADPALIPDHDSLRLTADGWYSAPQFLTEMKGSFEFLHENLLDTTHISFLHEGAFDSGGMAATPPQMEIKGNVIKVWRDLEETATAGTAFSFELVEGKTYNRRLITEAHVPNLEIVTNEFHDPKGNEPSRIRTSVIGITPGGPQLCYQINTQAMNYPTPRTINPDDPEVKKIIQRVQGIIYQDREMIGAVQERYNESEDDFVEVSVQADKAALEFRRMMVEMIKAEQPAA